MATAPNLPPHRREPLSDGEVLLQISYGLAEIRPNLGEISNAVKVLEDARKIYDERILQLIKTMAELSLRFPV